MAKGGELRLEDLLEGYWVGKRLGTGARSEIYAVKRKRDGYIFAAKFINVRTAEDQRIVGHLENEFTVLQALHNPKQQASEFIIFPVEFRKVKSMFKVRAAYLVMERAHGHSLFDKRDYVLDDVLTIFRQACHALQHIHNVGYVHADLKPQQILVDELKMIKMIDFGFAVPIGAKLDVSKGTFGYLAPEQAGGRLTAKTDIFNLGGALYWVLTGQNLPSIMPGQHERSGFVPGQKINILPPSRINPNVPDELSDMVLRCCSADEHERPTALELKRYLHGLALRRDYGAA
jgi:serine/threonine protein kinase